MLLCMGYCNMFYTWFNHFRHFLKSAISIKFIVILRYKYFIVNLKHIFLFLMDMKELGITWSPKVFSTHIQNNVCLCVWVYQDVSMYHRLYKGVLSGFFGRARASSFQFLPGVSYSITKKHSELPCTGSQWIHKIQSVS